MRLPTFRKFLSFVLSAFTIISLVPFEYALAASSNTSSYSYATELSKFPSSYRTLLSKLHATYPKWIFVADNTGLDFQKSVSAEANSVNNVISPSICSALMSSASNSSYANSNTVAYYMDPRNYLNKKDIFLFIDMSNNSSCTSAGVEAILSGTDLAKSSTYYRCKNGSKVSDSLSATYAKTILSAGSSSAMNPYFLASKIITENGGSLSKTATSGQNTSYPNIYNFYNIGAYTSATDGLKWASSGSTYSRPWKNPKLSISGGASFIYTNYYATGQKTEYFTKFNTSASTTKAKYSHQYMSSLYGAVNEAERMYKAYAATTLNRSYVFRIPVYENMPSTCSLLSLSKAASAVSFAKASKKATTTSKLTLRSGPATTYSSIASISSGSTLTITGGVATNNANRIYQTSNPYWLKATYGSHSGYVSAECISAASSYNIAKGKTKTLSYIRKTSADPLYFLSSNNDIATVSSSGVITGKKNGTCMIYAFSGGGFDVVGVIVSKSGADISLSAPQTETKLTKSNTAVTLSYSTHPYTGSALKPTVTVKYGSKKLKSGTDYKVTYSNNKEPGTATAKVTGIGTYTGSLSKTFTITALTAPYQATTKLTYRTGCGTNYTAKGSVASGHTVNVVYGWYRTVDGTPWLKMLINGHYYYISGKQLTRQVLVQYTTTLKLNYRTGCGTSHSIKGQFAKGKAVSIVQGWSKTVGGIKWYQVRVGSNNYYVMAKYLTRGETLLNYKTKATVNVRSAAGTSKTLKTILLKNTPVSVVKDSTKTVSGAKWYRIKINASYYYMMASYLTHS